MTDLSLGRQNVCVSDSKIDFNGIKFAKIQNKKFENVLQITVGDLLLIIDLKELMEEFQIE